MNPILKENTMRKRAHLPAIMLVTFLALAWLLVAPGRASAEDPYTVAFINVAIEASGLHTDVRSIKTALRLYKSEETLNADKNIDDWDDWNDGYAINEYNSVTFGHHQASPDIWKGVHPTEFTGIMNNFSLSTDPDRLDGRGQKTRHGSGSIQWAIQVSDYKEDGSQFSFEEMGFTHYRITCSARRYCATCPGDQTNMDLLPVPGAMPDPPDECTLGGEGNIQWGYECVDNTNCWMTDGGLYGPISDLVEE